MLKFTHYAFSFGCVSYSGGHAEQAKVRTEHLSVEIGLYISPAVLLHFTYAPRSRWEWPVHTKAYLNEEGSSNRAAALPVALPHGLIAAAPAAEEKTPAAALAGPLRKEL